MAVFLRITMRFLDSTFHGRGDGGEPEWPPSPLRLFQALIAAAAAQWNERRRLVSAVPALEWLAMQPPPAVVAPEGVAAAVPCRLYVPDNVADRVARAWGAGNTNASIADSRTEKDVRPVRLVGGDAVHYLYLVADGDSAVAEHAPALIAAARSVTHLGWGVDMVAGDGAVIITDEAVDALPGQRWRPVPDDAPTRLRVPRPGTLQALIERHTTSLGRLSAEGFRPVPPLTAFETVGYRRDTDPGARQFAAFRMIAADPDGPNPAFDVPRRAAEVAAWVRHATGEVCHGWPWPDLGAFVHGHAVDGGPLRGTGAHQRFAYLPLPSIERRGKRGEQVGAIRRVLVTAPLGCRDRIEYLRRRLTGQELVSDDGTATRRVHALLADLPLSDAVLRQYVETSAVWSTVTPVVWPGHDDHDTRKADRVLRKAFVDAGLPRGLVDGIVELAWRNVGFRPGVELASRYALPPRLGGRRSHVRVRFGQPVRGPLAVGAGRHRGLGVFAAEAT